MNISRKEWTFWITIHYSPKVCLIQEKFNATHHMKIASHGPEAIAGAVATFARKTHVNSTSKDHGSKHGVNKDSLFALPEIWGLVCRRGPSERLRRAL